MTLRKLAVKLLSLAAVTAVLAGCGAIVGNWAETRAAQAEAAYPPTGQLLEVNGTTVHAHVEGSGPDLILIHGASGNTRDWTFEFVDRVKDRYRVIAFDRPGLGWTERLPGFEGATNTKAESPSEQAALLKAAADQLDVENPIIVGHSFGGAVTLAWALDYPDHPAGLVLLGAASNPWPGDLGALYGINSSRVGGATVVPLISAFVPTSRIDDVLESIFEPQAAPEGYAEYVGAGLTLRRESLRANAQQVNSLRPHIVEMSKRYSKISVPTEIVHGTADTIVPLRIHSEPLSQQIPGAVLTRLDGIGHMPQHVSPDETIAAIDRAAARAGLR